MATASEAPPKTESVKQKRVVFVVGGPGSGKGTQCDLISRDFGVPFFSTGDLIRSLIASGCPEGKQLQDIILQGQIIPSEVTVGLLQKAMASATSDTVLIDGFPRNTENRTVWQSQVGYDCELVLLFDCPEEVMVERLRRRAEGRADDNEETIKKRVQNFKSQMAPVLDYYRAIGKVTTISTDRPVDDIYSELSSLWRQRFAASPV
ncbi:adenylate kinase [Volvox carteri f. nagariensis]|uniref:adenylate kinase n=1 Tax=Volvox carteri f. nagariensis TaxID=3068 RepID=D8TJD2_VOLCA|nr:adenylate kinase [Volvox carteri f. nagariensis]EFJ52351.1 adenylate kinase [Volvox carteri f. nagariensis]|eukprot:XP_002946424.1 adenylate kinase [Volvox carteri f. nagariensis]